MPAKESYNEKQLLAGVAAGDEQAFRQLIGSFADFLLTYLLQLTKNREMAEELVQDIFLQVWETREHLLHVRDFKAWLFIISRNYALKAIDKLLTQKKKHLRWEKEQQAGTATGQEEQWLGLIEQAVEQLPAQQRRVWIMHRRENKKYAVIAAELALSKETVKYYLKLANTSIIQFLKAHSDELLFFFYFILK